MRSFCSKILLFGEYSVLRNSKGLAIPYDRFRGRLRLPVERSSSSVKVDQELRAFGQYLRQSGGELFERILFDFDSYDFDVDQGLLFDSTIPQGQGIGSSGALCAAVLSKYSNINSTAPSMKELKEIFSRAESHFHGKSSGVDGMVSFLECPILIGDDSSFEKIDVDLGSSKKADKVLFLFSTGRARKTESLVNLFLEKCNNKSFSEHFDRAYVGATNDCIKFFLEKDFGKLYDSFSNISQFQLKEMTAMIPPLLKKDWEKGLNKGPYLLKICGAGGGGFFIGLTTNYQQTKAALAPFITLPIVCFN